MNLPESFTKEMRSLLGDEYEEYEKSFANPAKNALRVNNRKISTEEFLRICPYTLEKIPWIENGFYYREEEWKPSKHPYYYAGLYYIQEPSAMTPASRLPIVPGDRVLDLCAAPGGKATEIAVRLSGRGMLLANDISNSRAKALLKNLEMQGAENYLVTSESPERLMERYPEFFDKILLDAPCSGEGMFRKEPSMIRYFEENPPKSYAPVQRELIRQAFSMLRPGGSLLYSTCTFSAVENEEIIAGFLAENTDAMLLAVAPYYEGFAPGMETDGRDMSDCVRIFPHRMAGEGHFLALLGKKERTGQPSDRRTAGRNGTKKPPREAENFLSLIRRNWNGTFLGQGEQLYFLPEGMEAERSLRYLRTGLFLGTIKRGRFDPSQALAMNLRAEEFSSCLSFAADDERVIRYLKGETLRIDDLPGGNDKGYKLVCVDGYPLGFGKAAGGTLKNKYYAGWRIQ